MEAMVEEATGVKVLSLHHDISTATGRGGHPLHPRRVAPFPRREEIRPDSLEPDANEVCTPGAPGRAIIVAGSLGVEWPLTSRSRHID